ncbi:MAG: hypothetical protein WC444_04940 [Candidatus Paceibacterota bacterium]
MLKKATFGNEKNAFYEFSNKVNWAIFWREQGGCRDTIKKWAEKTGIVDPGAWYECLHAFLFGHWNSSEPIRRPSKVPIKVATKHKFSEFLKQAAENHQESPKPNSWYINYGMTKDAYVSALERSSDIPEEQAAISYLNTKCLSLGHQLFEEYLLTLVPVDEEMKQTASRLRKKAAVLERKASIVQSFKKGDKVKYVLLQNKTLEVQGTVEGAVIGRDTNNGSLSYVEDVWNLERV